MLFALLACSMDTHVADAPVGTLRGHVLLDDGTPVSGAQVEILASTFTTDVEGAFDVSGLSTGDVAVTIRSAATTTGQATVAVEAGETTEATFQVLAMRDATLADAGAGGVVRTSDGLELSFPANGLVDADGSLVSGPVQIDYALLNTALSLAAAPGGLLTLDAEGDPAPLVSNGMVEVRLSQGGGEVQPVAPVTLSFPIIGNLAPCGVDFDLYWFDEQAATWILEGGGRVVGERFVATVDHFSYWNCDAQASGNGCIDVSLLRDGAPFANQRVGVWLSNGMAANLTTDSLGAIRIPAPEGALVTVGIVYDAEGRVNAEDADLVWSLGPVEVPMAADGCEYLGTLEATGLDLDGDGEAIQPWGWECYDEDPARTEPCPGQTRDAAIDTGPGGGDSGCP